MTYASASDVAALTVQITGGASTFSASTTPTLNQVNFWLSTGCAVVNVKLAGMGYGPIPVSSVAYGLAQQAESVYAAWFVERARNITRTTDNENAKSSWFKRDFFDLLEQLENLNLSNAGVPYATTGTDTLLYAGGISISDKQGVEGDGDRVQPRFTRDMFKNPESLFPVSHSGTTSAS